MARPPQGPFPPAMVGDPHFSLAEIIGGLEEAIARARPHPDLSDALAKLEEALDVARHHAALDDDAATACADRREPSARQT